MLYQRVSLSCEIRRNSSVPPPRKSRYRCARPGSESSVYAVPRTEKSAKFSVETGNDWAAAGVVVDGSGAFEGSWICCATSGAANDTSTTNGRVRRKVMDVPSPQESVASRAVRSVNLRVAVHAAAPDQPVAARGELRAVVNRGGMPRADVAPLAQHRQFGDEHPIVV